MSSLIRIKKTHSTFGAPLLPHFGKQQISLNENKSDVRHTMLRHLHASDFSHSLLDQFEMSSTMAQNNAYFLHIYSMQDRILCLLLILELVLQLTVGKNRPTQV
jgi:hypothetical protein